ncbi:MAG TPA: hypothetical protein VM307_09125 [Egibacteraceae bacterium]|nr:hypothetical protein [Egibacteraceae bacterium]
MPILRFISLGFVKTLTKIFGLATMTFFGRLPSRDDDKVSLIGLLSLWWLGLIVSAIFPPVAEALIPFLPDDEALLRGVSIALVVAIPLLVGWLVTRMHNYDSDKSSLGREMLHAFMYCGVIGGLVVLLVVVVPVVKASYILRRFEMKNIAIMVKQGGYDDVLQQIRDAFERHGIETSVEDPHRIIRFIFCKLVWIEGRIFRRDMVEKMKIVRGEVQGNWFEVTLHAADISIIGQKDATTHAMAVLSEELDETYVYFSWDDDGQQLEDRILAAQRRVSDGEPVDDEQIAQMCDDLRRLALESEEWDAIRRQIYRVEVANQRLRAERALAEEPVG